MKLYVAGHRGMVGSAIIRKIQDSLTEGLNSEILTVSSDSLDLRNQSAVNNFLALEKPELIIIAAAKVGGIHANNIYPADFIYNNLMIQSNLIHGAFCNNVQKLLFLGSSCIYPRMADQPMKEDALLTGPLETTNEPYAVAKIAGIKLCESYNRQYGTDFRSVMPTNLYGRGDNFHLENSHVVPALIRRFHDAKISQATEVVIWGNGLAKREFLHVEDMADASLFVMNLEKEEYLDNTNPMLSHINVGSSEEISIRELAEIIKKVTGYEGAITFDTSKPNGTPRKLLDSSCIKNIGWEAKIGLYEGLIATYDWYTGTL